MIRNYFYSIFLVFSINLILHNFDYRNEEMIRENLKFFVLLSINYYYYIFYVVFYENLVDKIANNDSEFVYINGIMKTKERYAITKTTTNDIIYTSIYSTFSVGSVSMWIPNFTNEYKLKSEENTRFSFTFQDDLLIGNEKMYDDEWLIDNDSMVEIKWDRELTVATRDTVKYKQHLYPEKKIQILAEKVHDYYKVHAIYNDDTPLIVCFEDWAKLHKVAIGIFTMVVINMIIFI